MENPTAYMQVNLAQPIEDKMGQVHPTDYGSHPISNGVQVCPASTRSCTLLKVTRKEQKYNRTEMLHNLDENPCSSSTLRKALKALQFLVTWQLW